MGPRLVMPRLYSRSPSPPPEWKSRPREHKKEQHKREIATENKRDRGDNRKMVDPVVEEHIAARTSLIEEQVNQMKKAIEENQKNVQATVDDSKKKKKEEKEKKDEKEKDESSDSDDDQEDEVRKKINALKKVERILKKELEARRRKRQRNESSSDSDSS